MLPFDSFPSPCFVLDEAKLLANAATLHKIGKQDERIRPLFTLKGFANWRVFHLFRPSIQGATASSLHEARLAHEEMGKLVHTYCVAYEEETFDEVLHYSDALVFNSISQAARFSSKARKTKPEVSMGLRIHHEHSEAETTLYNPARAGSRLGASIEVLAQMKRLPPHMDGLHLHSLCENDSYALERTLKVVEDKVSHLLRQAQWLNLGGGHGTNMAGYDVAHLLAVLGGVLNRYPNLHVYLEPCTAWVWEAGYLVSTVLDIVENEGIKTAILNISFICHIPETIEVPYRPRVVGASLTPNPTHKHLYRLGSLSCLAGDFLDSYAFAEPLRIGQRVVFQNTAQYTTVRSTQFNGIRHPNIILYRQNDTQQILRTFSYEDYKQKFS